MTGNIWECLFLLATAIHERISFCCVFFVDKSVQLQAFTVL
jgi:hypothetical protein